MPYLAAMADRVSPLLTVYVDELDDVELELELLELDDELFLIVRTCPT